MSLEEELGENYFIKTVSRGKSGRYTVSLPFKYLLFEKPLPTFNNTDFHALGKLKYLESSFKNKPQFAKAYEELMTEYIELDHMKRKLVNIHMISLISVFSYDEARCSL